MQLIKTVAVGVLGYLAYQAWQKRTPGPPRRTRALRDTGGRTPPHGDTLHIHDQDVEPLPPRTAQASRGFGGDD